MAQCLFCVLFSLAQVREIRGQLLDIMKQQKVPHVSCGSAWDNVRKCICASYFYNAARLKVSRIDCLL